MNRKENPRKFYGNGIYLTGADFVKHYLYQGYYTKLTGKFIGVFGHGIICRIDTYSNLEN